MPRRGMKEDTSDGPSPVAVSKFGLAGVPMKENLVSLGITRNRFMDNGRAENVGNVRAIAERMGLSRSGISNSTSTGHLLNSGFGYERPWYGASGISFPKGKAFHGNSFVDNAASSQSSSIASSCNEAFKITAANGRLVTRNAGKSISPGGRRKRIASGDGRSRIREELNLPGDLNSSVTTEDLEATPRETSRETPRRTENAPRSILKHDANTRSKPSQVLPYQKLSEDDNRNSLSTVTAKQQKWPYILCRQQNSQTPSPITLPPPPFRQSRIPRCTFFNVNGYFRQIARSKSADGCCYRRQNFSNLKSQYPSRREDAVTGKKSHAKLQAEDVRSAIREWEYGGTTGGEVGVTCDWSAAYGSRGVSSHGVGDATGRGVGTSDSTRRVHSENDVRRSVRRSPQMEEEHCSDKVQNFRRHYGWLSPRSQAQHVDNDHDNDVDGDNDDNEFTMDEPSLGSRRPDYDARCSWSNLIDIVTDTPHLQQQPQTVALEMAPPSVSSEAPGSTRPYYRRIFDWLSRLTDMRSNSKMSIKASENHVVPDTTGAQNMFEASLREVKLSEPDNFSQGVSPSNNDTPRSKLTGQPNTHMNSDVLGKDSSEPEYLSRKPQMMQKDLKSCLSTTCSKVEKNPSELKSCLSVNRSRAQINLAELKTCSRILANSPEPEQYPVLKKTGSSEQKLANSKRQKNSGDPKPSTSRPELKSSEEQYCYSRTPMSPSDLTMSSSAMDISGSRLDRMQADAAVIISQMREPDFGFQKKLLKSETLLTKSLTKEFEETANMPSSYRRTEQLRKLLSELPVENFYVVEWLVTNNIINESNANRFGRLFHVKPHVLEVLTRHRDHLFPDAL